MSIWWCVHIRPYAMPSKNHRSSVNALMITSIKEKHTRFMKDVEIKLWAVMSFSKSAIYCILSSLSVSVLRNTKFTLTPCGLISFVSVYGFKETSELNVSESILCPSSGDCISLFLFLCCGKIVHFIQNLFQNKTRKYY